MGAWDLHTHSSPSHFHRALDDFQLLEDAERWGMAGVMIKCHYEPTGPELNWPTANIRDFEPERWDLWCLTIR